MKDNKVKNIGLSAMFIAIGLILPFFTGQVPKIGNMLLPMHIPVFICGFVCGWNYGLVVGAILPLVRSIIFGMPVLFPNALAMAVELAIYGLVTGLIYKKAKKQNIVVVYISLFSAMVAGRIAWGITEVILLRMAGSSFTWQMFVTGALLNAIPGIIIQLIIIPAVMEGIKKLKLYRRNG